MERASQMGWWLQPFYSIHCLWVPRLNDCATIFIYALEVYAIFLHFNWPFPADKQQTVTLHCLRYWKSRKITLCHPHRLEMVNYQNKIEPKMYKVIVFPKICIHYHFRPSECLCKCTFEYPNKLLLSIENIGIILSLFVVYYCYLLPSFSIILFTTFLLPWSKLFVFIGMLSQVQQVCAPLKLCHTTSPNLIWGRLLWKTAMV